jgi:hypothetical protein
VHFRVSNANDGGGSGEVRANTGRRCRRRLDPCCAEVKEMNLLLAKLQ